MEIAPLPPPERQWSSLEKDIWFLLLYAPINTRIDSELPGNVWMLPNCQQIKEHIMACQVISSSFAFYNVKHISFEVSDTPQISEVI